MICDFCQGRTKARKVKKHHWLKKRLYLVENVPAEVCQECGERYFHATTLDDIDRMLSKKHHVKENLKVEVVSLVMPVAVCSSMLERLCPLKGANSCRIC